MSTFRTILHLRRRLDLRAGTDVEGTVQRITSEAALTAENLWLLACSAILASIGLDLGSPAVIIGAMLISPLMGPILGVGLGVGVTNRALLQRSLRELALATSFTIVVSAVYFLLSPLAVPTAEIVARTRPTLLDVGVAFFGGVAGIVAGSRRRPSLALPGVAIATALMPPLCTAGFGLATANWAFFFGAFYLYCLNAIFIALSTFLVVRILRFPHHEEVTVEARQRERRAVAALALLATLPSAYFLYDAVHDVRERRQIADFVREEVEAPGRAAPQWDLRRSPGPDVLQILVAGHPIDSVGVEALHAALPRYGLSTLRLEIVQSDVSMEDIQRLQGDFRRDLLHALSSARRAPEAPIRLRQDSLRVSLAARDLAATFPEIERMTYAPRWNLLAPDSNASPPAVLVEFARPTSKASRRDILARCRGMLRQRLEKDSVLVMER